MAQLTQDQKREITRRLGYRTVDQEGTGKHDLYGPDGRHRAIFRPSKAADAWVWNDAVFSVELYQHRDGGVHRRSPSASGVRLAPLWPEEGPPREVEEDALSRDFERLGASKID